MNTEKPRYEHDCESCTFLGQFYEYDLYFCLKGHLSTVIARYGHEGYEYLSGIAGIGGMPPLTKAAYRAIEKGLLNPDSKVGITGEQTIAETINKSDDRISIIASGNDSCQFYYKGKRWSINKYGVIGFDLGNGNYDAYNSGFTIKQQLDIAQAIQDGNFVLEHDPILEQDTYTLDNVGRYNFANAFDDYIKS